MPHSLTRLSSPAVTKKSAPLGATETPLTMPRCAAMLQTHFLDARSHTRTSPSQAPDINCTRLLCGDAEHQTPSVCPSRAPTNGFAKTRSSFVALRARRYSRACAKGCTSAEAFLGRTFTSVASSRVHFFSERASALNFIASASPSFELPDFECGKI